MIDFQWNFSENEKVKVISHCETHGKSGTIVERVIKHWTNKKKYYRVKLDDGRYRTYGEESLISLEDNKMANEVQGNYRIAMVRHIQNCANHNTEKVYAFALFDNDIVIGDKVLCDSEGGYSVAEVIDIKSKIEYSQTHSRVVTKEIICKVDFSAFDERVAKRREMASIKAEMDKLVAENQDMILYQAIADKNSTMAALLERYKTINNI